MNWKIFTLVLLTVFTSGRAADMDQLRGDSVGWARLKTSSPHWMRHSTGDPLLMRFFRENTTLNIAPNWETADVENLEEMCAYPFLFTQGIHTVRSATAQHNIGEYIRRGGFLLIDACINHDVTPSVDGFYDDQVRALAVILPEAHVVSLPNNHPIYDAFFHIPGGPPHTNVTYEWVRRGLYGIEWNSRLVGVISFSGLQCGWDGMEETRTSRRDSMRMLVNIYVYAMLRTQ
ncbi:MAG: DUF4159 domain-containing protein [Chthoniobacterales bacterium]